MSWRNPPINFGVEVLRDADQFTKKITGEMLQQVVLRSPVDTGAFRGNHRVGIGALDPNANKADTSSPLQKGLATIQSGGGLGKLVYISNSLPYAIRLENGWSEKQAPLGVYSISFMNVVNKYR